MDLIQTDVLSDCIVTLVKWAIKDNGISINVLMDLTTGYININNLGDGINKECLPQHYDWDGNYDFESNGLNSKDSINKLIINHLLSVSKIVTIESHVSFGSSFKVIYYEGRIERIELIKYCENIGGTHISVQLKNNYLFSGTVDDLEKVRSQLKRKVASIMLMNPKVEIELSDEQSSLRTFGCNTCMSSVFFELIDHHGKNVSVNASYENIKMNVHFVFDFHNSDQYQFIFFNKIFIDLKVLYKTLNDFFDVAFSKRNIEIKDQEHFIYLLEIECSDFEIIDLIQGLKNNDESNLVNKMIMCLISLEQNMLENYYDYYEPINYTYDCSDYNTKLEMDSIMEKSNFSELQTGEINFSKYFSNKSLYTQEKEIDNLITKWLIYDVGSFLLKLIKPCTLINHDVNLNVLLKNEKYFFDLKVISKKNKQLQYLCINKEIWTHFIREVKCFDIDMSSKFLKFCFKVLLKLLRESMSYEIGHNIDTCTQISVLFPKLIEMVYNTKFLPPFSMICDDTCNNAISRIIITNAAINCTDNSVLKMKSSTNIKGNFDLIDNLENENSMSNKTLPTYKFCDTINNFIISGRNPFVPKGSSPIMLVKDKLFIASLNSDINKSQLENINNRKRKRSVEFIIENERELKFSPNQKLWTIDKKFFNELEVIGQLDKKYILCMVNTQVKTVKDLIVLDQHAIDERIQLEKLLSSFSDPIFEGCLKTHFLLEYWLIISPIKKDLQTILKYTEYFKKSGLQFTEIPNGTVAVISIPECLYWIASKKDRPLAYRSSPSCTVFSLPLILTAESTTEYYNFLSDSVKTIINEQLSSIYESGTIRHIIPSVLYKHLCREACLKAVNFGNILSISDCQQLISKISFCSLPFMCAHGRPVISFLRKIIINPRNVNYPSLKKLKK